MIRPEVGALRRELIGFAGIVERKTYLIRRFVWWELAWFLYTVANTLTTAVATKYPHASHGAPPTAAISAVRIIGVTPEAYTPENW